MVNVDLAVFNNPIAWVIGQQCDSHYPWTKESWMAYIKEHGIPNAKKFDKTMSKENHLHWKGGITPENKLIRNSNQMKEWRKAVFTRDKYICIMCFGYFSIMYIY